MTAAGQVRDRDAAIARLREAARRTSCARQSRRVAKARRALSQVELSTTGGPIAAKIREFLTELDRETDSADRWALARELDELLRAGCRSVQLARLLIRAGVRPGTQTVRDVRRALVWIRKERERFRRASRQTGEQTSGVAVDERQGPRVLVRRTVSTESLTETATTSRPQRPKAKQSAVDGT